MINPKTNPGYPPAPNPAPAPKSRTPIVALVAGVLAGLASAFGLDVSPEESLAIAGGVAAAIAVAMRNRGHKPPAPPTDAPHA